MNKFSKISVLLASLALSFSVAAALQPGQGVAGLKAELAKVDTSDEAAVLAFANSAKELGYTSADFTSAWTAAGLDAAMLATVLIEAFPTAAGPIGGSGSGTPSGFGSLAGASSFAGGGGGSVSKN